MINAVHLRFQAAQFDVLNIDAKDFSTKYFFFDKDSQNSTLSYKTYFDQRKLDCVIKTALSYNTRKKLNYQDYVM